MKGRAHSTWASAAPSAAFPVDEGSTAWAPVNDKEAAAAAQKSFRTWFMIGSFQQW
jgi:hypothetical protein